MHREQIAKQALASYRNVFGNRHEDGSPLRYALLTGGEKGLEAEGKEYAVILDFIGNYRNNFMIPIALSGDRSYNKDNIRRYLMQGERVIPGASTIHFDEISRNRIFEAIDAANFSDLALIKENYANLKNKLGRIPALADFDTYGEMDVCRIFDNKSLGSYYKFLVKYEKGYKVRLTARQEKIIEFISAKLASGKRVRELELLRRLMRYRDALMQSYEKAMSADYGIRLDQNAKESVINVLTNEFQMENTTKTAVEIEWALETPVREDIYEYIIG